MPCNCCGLKAAAHAQWDEWFEFVQLSRARKCRNASHHLTKCNRIVRCVCRIWLIESAALHGRTAEVAAAVRLEIHAIVCAACAVRLRTLKPNTCTPMSDWPKTSANGQMTFSYAHAHVASHANFVVVVGCNGIFASLRRIIRIVCTLDGDRIAGHKDLVVTFRQIVQCRIVGGICGA